MGTLEIRPASERLRDLGQFRMPELDTGAARFHEAQARASLSAANAAATAGRAAVHGIASRGQVVARTLGTLGRLALDFAEQEDSRIATDAVLAKRRERNLYMYGDGTDGNPGQFNLPFDRAEDWIKGLKAENDRMDAAHTKDMNARQRRLYREAMARDEVEWQLRIGSHAARRSLQMETATAVAATAQARDEAVMKFPEAPFRDAAIKAFYDAKEHEMDVRGLSQGERRLERKAATEDFLSNLATRSFERWEAEIRADGGLRADPEAVERAWTEKGKELYAGGGKVPTNPLVRAALGSDALDEAHRTLLARRFDDARRRSVAEAYRVRSEGWRAAREEAARREYNLLSAPVPEDAKGQAAHFEQLAADYEGIAAEAALSPDDRLRYLKTARALKDSVRRAKDDARDAEMEDCYRSASADFAAGFSLDASGRPVELNGATKLETADRLLRQGRITPQRYRDLHAVADKEWDDEAVQLRQLLLDRAAWIAPNAIRYRERQNDFALAETKTLRASNSTRIKMRVAGKSLGVFDRHQEMTYGELVRAYNLVLEWRKARGASVDEAARHFDGLIAGTVAAQLQRTVKESLDYEKKTIDAYRNR